MNELYSPYVLYLFTTQTFLGQYSFGITNLTSTFKQRIVVPSNLLVLVSFISLNKTFKITVLTIKWA